MKIWAEFQVPSDLTEWLTLAQNLVGVKNLTNLVRCKFTLPNLAQISSRRINFISFQFVCTLYSLPLWHACIFKSTTTLKEVWFLENFNSQLPNDILNLYLCCSYYLVHNAFMLKGIRRHYTIARMKGIMERFQIIVSTCVIYIDHAG